MLKQIPKERAAVFTREYVKDFNGTRAAIAAGYDKKSAHVTAARMLKRDTIQKAIAALVNRRLEKLDISSDFVLGELRKLAGYDATQVFDDDGAIRPISEWPADVKTALVGLDHDKLFEHFGKGQSKHVGTTSKIKLADKLRALELLGKYLKLFTERIEITDDSKILAALAAGRKRVAELQ